MLTTTLLHYDKFNQGRAHDGLPDPPTLATLAFDGWTIVYILSPAVVGWLWWRNQRLDPGVPEDDEALVSPALRSVVRVIAIGALLGAVAVLVAPSVAIDSWGWTLTPLTARVIACFTAQVGIAFLLLSCDSRWSSWRILVQTFLIAVALLLLGAIREWSTFLSGRPMKWAYLAGLLGAGFWEVPSRCSPCIARCGASTSTLRPDPREPSIPDDGERSSRAPLHIQCIPHARPS
jgi:hypothetical protein